MIKKYDLSLLKGMWNKTLRKNKNFDLTSAIVTARYMLGNDIAVTMSKSGKTIAKVEYA